MIFLFVAAEEDGLLGSAYYAANPFVPLGQTAAVLNLDLPAPLAPPTRWYLETNSTPLLELGQVMARGRGWEVVEARVQPSSDHWSFVLHGVPSAFIVPGEGWEGATPEQEQALIERWWRPHRPDDEWSDDFPAAGLARVAEFALRLALAIADAPARPLPDP